MAFNKDITEGGVLPAKNVFNGFGHSGENQVVMQT